MTAFSAAQHHRLAKELASEAEQRGEKDPTDPIAGSHLQRAMFHAMMASLEVICEVDRRLNPPVDREPMRDFAPVRAI